MCIKVHILVKVIYKKLEKLLHKNEYIRLNCIHTGLLNMCVYDSRAFSVAGPRLWNSLPTEVHLMLSLYGFWQMLKTYLFTLTFGS